MKNPLTALLPALALFALGGCAGTSALTSSEDDGVYYSSRDRTTAIVNSPAPTSTDEAANPDYNGNANSSSSRQGNQGNTGSDQYYDNTYTYMRGVPNYGVTAYTPYSPYTTLSYGAGAYGWGGGACGFSPYPYGFCDPFYSSFYSPYYGYGSGVSINIGFGFGRPYGYGGYGYGRPYGYGYGGGFYDPYYYSSPFYGGYYGRGGYYGNNYGSYYGNNHYGSNGGYGGNGGYYSNDRNRPNTTTGHRTDRMSDGRYSTGGVNTPNPATPTPGGGRPRSTMDGRMAPGTGMQPVPAEGANRGNRSRGEEVLASPSPQPARAEESYNRPRRMDGAEQPRYRNMEQPATDQSQVNNDNTRGRWRTTESQPQGTQQQTSNQPARQDGQRRRGGFFQDVFTQPANQGQNDGQAAGQQPARQRSYEQPQQQQPQQQRTYEQPRQRAYEQPQQQQRSYSQPSYSAPSNGGGGGGGGRSRGRGE